jgi:hypothetical protein
LIWHDAPLAARDKSGQLRLESQTLEAAFDPIEGMHLDANFGGIAQYLYGQNPIGSIKATGKFDGTEFGVSLARQLKTDSLSSIRNRYFSTETILSAERELFWGIKVKGELHHISYSYRNIANSGRFSPEYDFKLFGADLGLGYRVQYTKLARHISDGSYNPLISLGQQVFWHCSYDAEPFSLCFDVAGGRNTTKNTPTSAFGTDFSGEGTGTIGWNIGERFLAELTASDGNYGLNYPARGWSEMSTGFRLKYSF